MNDFRQAAKLSTLLTGVDLPAPKQKLIAYAQAERAERELIAALERVPEREYRTLDEVAEALAPVQARATPGEEARPRAESGAPPGGPDYVQANPTPGAVRESYPT